MKITRYLDGRRVRWWESWPNDGREHHLVSFYEPRWWERLMVWLRRR